MLNFRLFTLLRSSIHCTRRSPIHFSLQLNETSCLRTLSSVKNLNNTFHYPIRLFSRSSLLNDRRTSKDKYEKNVINENEEEKEEEPEEEKIEEEGSDQTDQEKIRESLQKYNLPKGYRIIIKHLASLRLDLVCSTAIGVGRSTIEEEFYGSKLRVNGEKSTKKAQQVKEGDTIDLIVSRTDGAKYNSKRIIVYKIFEGKSLKNKVKVCLVAWRQGIEVDGSSWA